MYSHVHRRRPRSAKNCIRLVRYLNGQFVVSKRPGFSRLRIYAVAAAAAAAIALLNYLIGLWMAARGLHAEATFFDEFLLAVFTGGLVFTIELLHRRERERMNEKLKTIELMNHHVRNSLQAIIDSAYVHGHLDEIQTSVNRIAWALREVLPGQVLDSHEELRRSPAIRKPNPRALRHK